ncbi:phosphoribosylaminoimidazolecarboxamide formyltransferase [Mycobacterium sp. CBMA 234]|uniref:DoxX family protein n=1 Tax=Mycolicibacterium sp. CBMA 234 TaxID=1918495 RepID=UPI0012DFBD15|nr:DoxX family protein [Mycolicibacterium sp. CBMA 234]MUL65292.1 phosphoribosylaminoimidazolecarboxamide formyltransferase [Mycolicibacterium sp. CBMA 234]
MAQLDIESRLDTVAPLVLSVFRIVIGFLFALHGATTLFKWPVDTAPGMASPEFGSFPGWYAGAIELIVGILIFTGLATRIAAFIGSGEMAFAYFMEHQPQGLLPIANGGEPAVLYCFALFLLVFTGGGALSLDAMRRR